MTKPVLGTLDVVVGAQFGSESKGRVTSQLADRRRNLNRRVIGVRVAGPNAGHVVIDEDGRRWPLRQIPVTAVSREGAADNEPLCIAPGSEIDPEVLRAEVAALDKAGYRVTGRLFIDGAATIITDRHKAEERSLVGRIGSTGKGIGAARADRLMRRASVAENYAPTDEQIPVFDRVMPSGGVTLMLQVALGDARAVVIEGTQGYGLGQHAGHYPMVTSSDCRAIDFLAMAGISPWGHALADFAVWAVARTFPIRVAGDSGRLDGETTWQALGLPDEHTTVTQKVRRVGAWDGRAVAEAVAANGGSKVRLCWAMADQWEPRLAGMTVLPVTDGPLCDRVLDRLKQIEAEAGTQVWNIGTGPTTSIWL